jgi:hypothetical protein
MGVAASFAHLQSVYRASTVRISSVDGNDLCKRLQSLGCFIAVYDVYDVYGGCPRDAHARAHIRAGECRHRRHRRRVYLYISVFSDLRDLAAGADERSLPARNVASVDAHEPVCEGSQGLSLAQLGARALTAPQNRAFFRRTGLVRSPVLGAAGRSYRSGEPTDRRGHGVAAIWGRDHGSGVGPDHRCSYHIWLRYRLSRCNCSVFGAEPTQIPIDLPRMRSRQRVLRPQINLIGRNNRGGLPRFRHDLDISELRSGRFGTVASPERTPRGSPAPPRRAGDLHTLRNPKNGIWLPVRGKMSTGLTENGSGSGWGTP